MIEKTHKAILTEWLSQRDLLNHDVLCNQLRNELASLRSEPTQVITPRLSSWPKRKTEYTNFLNDTIEAISFARILDTSIFDCWGTNQKAFWEPVFHELFLATTDVREKIHDLNELLNESVEAVIHFNEISPKKRTIEMIVSLQRKLDALSAGISSLPNNVGKI